MPKTPSSRSRLTRSSLSKPYARRLPCDAGGGDEGATSISAEQKEAWDATRCSICLEAPHNGVLLICAGHEKGCNPYVCDTSARHSNCLDTYKRTAREEVEGKEGELRLPCPLCRGTVTGQKVNKSARHYWNQKERPCAKESCTFQAKYHTLRVHARTEHPNEHPTEVKPEQAQKWQRAEREREMQDVLSAAFSGPNGEGPNMESDARGWTVYFLFHMLDGEIGGFSVGRRIVVGAGQGRRTGSASTRRFHWGSMPDSDSEGGTQGAGPSDEAATATPTHQYFTRSRQEAPAEAAPREDSHAEEEQEAAPGVAEQGPAYRTRSVGLRQHTPEADLGQEEDAGVRLSWRAVAGAGSGGVGGRRLQRWGRIRMPRASIPGLSAMETAEDAVARGGSEEAAGSTGASEEGEARLA